METKNSKVEYAIGKALEFTPTGVIAKTALHDTVEAKVPSGWAGDPVDCGDKISIQLVGPEQWVLYMNFGKTKQ